MQSEVENLVTRQSKRNILKWVLIGALFFVIFVLVRWLSMYFLLPEPYKSVFYPDRIVIAALVVIILLSLLIVYFFAHLIILRRKKRKIETDKRFIKNSLITFFILFILFITAFAFIVYDVLDSNNRMKVIKSVDYSKYNRENPKCYEKCKKAYKWDDQYYWKYAEHINKCTRICIRPKWNACIEDCKVSTLWEELKWKYNYENYENWFKNKYPGKNPVSFEDGMKNYWIISHDILKEERQYIQWINEEFSWYNDKVKKYELCEDSCGPAPKYTFIN